jgi:putative transposase
MTRKRRPVQLTQDEYEFLTTYVAHGQKNARQINRARTLLLSHDGKADQDIVKVLGISRATVYNVRKRYHQQKYDHIVEILNDKPRLGRPIAFDHKVEANVSMIACSKAPKGCARWTLHLIADKLVQLIVVDSISHESVRSLLKKTNLSLG